LVFLGASNFAFSNTQFTYNVIQDGIEVTGCVDDCPSDLVIPEEIDGYSLVGIADWAFHDIGLTSVTIPDSVTSIGRDAFSRNHLTNVTIPDSVTNIEDMAFQINQLSSIIIPSSIDSIKEGVFYSNQLTSVSIPNSVTSIDGEAFRSNSLGQIELPAGLNEIAYWAFADNQLTSLIIPSSVSYIGRDAFRNNQLNNVQFLGDLPDTVFNIFSENPAITNDEFRYFPYGDSALLMGCAELCPSNLVIPQIIDGYRVIGIDSGAFEGKQLTALTIPDSVIFIGFRAFFGNQLTTLALSGDVTRIRGSSFADNQLTSLLFLGGRPEIGNDAFDNNINLTNVSYCPNFTGWPGEPINGITPELTENCNLNSNPNSDSDGDGILDFVDPDPLDSELLYYSVSDIPDLVPDQTLRDCLTNLANGAEGLGHISDVYCSSRNDDGEDLTPIASIEGLQYFPNLTHLWIDSSEISSLAPISNLENIVSLVIDNGHNSISDLTPLTALDSIEVLILQDGSLTSEMLQPIVLMPNLKELRLGYNAIEDIGFLSSLNSEIESLWLQGNPIQDFTPVGSLTSLKKFYGYYNPMDNLNYLSDLQNLEVIGISETGISDITVLKDLPNLIDVRLNGNPIRRVSGIFTNMESGSININDTQIWCHEYDELMAEIATDVEVIYDSSCILDSDQDGFSDQFETDYGLDPFTATLDIDQDGVPNEDDSDNDNDGLPDEHDFAPFDPSNESESIIVFENGTVGPEWDEGIRAYDQSIGWDNTCLEPEDCPSIDWAMVNDEERGDVLEVTFTENGQWAGIFISSSDSVDLRGARENGVLGFDIKSIQRNGNIYAQVGCGFACGGGYVNFIDDDHNEWQTIVIPVQDLISNGWDGFDLDLESVKAAIVLEAGAGSTFRIDNVFYDCQSPICDGSNLPINAGAGFTYEFIEDGIELTSCQGECPSELIIPESIDGHTVTSIGIRAFYGDASADALTSVHLPNSLKVIGNGAFMHNRLESLTIPTSVIRIGEQAFLNNSLTSLHLPDNNLSIGHRAFYGNSLSNVDSLNHDINFEDENTEYYQPPFDGNAGIDNGEWRYFSVNEELILFGCSEQCPTDLVIPEYIDGFLVTKIGESAFKNQQLNSVIFPQKVDHIGFSAFAGNSLSTVSLPSSLELISHFAFGDNQIVTLNIPSSSFISEWDVFEGNPLETIYYCDETYNGGDIEGIIPQYNESCDLGQGNDDVSSPYQSVAITGEPVGLLGENLQLTVSYHVSDGEDDLTGLGLRMHYDSSVLTFVTFDSVLESNNISALGPIQDTQDIDNDSSTDQYISASWASLYIDWPGGLPADLFNAIFEVSNNETLSQTDINFSAISTTAGYGFSGEPYNLNIIAGSWDFDGNGAVDALTDGLLLLRHAFGLSGSTLTDFAVSPDSPNTATEIETHMNRIMSIADIDGDGNVDALTDGLLLLRYAFELRGDNLVANVISDNATRTSSADIESYIDAHMP
jgi:Leucine-rich repeat (LRR) protein